MTKANPMPRTTAAASPAALPEATLKEIRNCVLHAQELVDAGMPYPDDAYGYRAQALAKVDSLLKRGRK